MRMGKLVRLVPSKPLPTMDATANSLSTKEVRPFDEPGNSDNTNKIIPQETTDASKERKPLPTPSTTQRRDKDSNKQQQQQQRRRRRRPPATRRLSDKDNESNETSTKRAKSKTGPEIIAAASTTIPSEKTKRKVRRKDNNNNNKDVLTNGSPSSARANSSSSNKDLDKPIIQDRSKLDVARDKKRILEICYGGTESGTVVNDGIEVSTKPLPTDEKNQENVGNPQDATERKKIPREGTIPPQVTPTSSTKKKKKRSSKKKRIVNRKDAAGRVVRKRLKSKGRGKVVKADCFRKGKDAKIGLATINEDFYDDLVETDSDSIQTDSCDGMSTDFSSDEEDNDGDSNLDGDDNDDFDAENVSSDKDAQRERAGNRRKNNAQRNRANQASSGNEVTANGQLRSASDPPAFSNINRATSSNEAAAQTFTDSATIVDAAPGSAVPSVDSTACTSTASAQNSNPRAERCVPLLCRSKWSMICAGLSFVVVVAAGTLLIGYFTVFREGSKGDRIASTPPVVPSMAPSSIGSRPSLRPSQTQSVNNVGSRPNLRPSQPPSDSFEPLSSIVPTESPSSIFNTLSTSCYLPNENSGAITVETENSTEQYGFATVSNANAGYCGEGYVTILMFYGSGFGFSSVKVNKTGYYRLAMRYSNPGEAKISLTLLINDQYKGTFDLESTGNETSWMVGGIGNVLMREGEHAIRIAAVDSNDMKGPSVDWLTLVIQEPLSEFDYVSGLIAKANGVAAQTLSQTFTIQWMSNEDLIDYSKLTDEEIIERYALLQIYHSTAGDMWTNTNQWLSEFHVCDWYGITCSRDMVVTDLMLDNNGLLGLLPTGISLLTNLIVISLDNNELQGTIPTQVGRLINLSKLFLQANFFSGFLPSELGSLENLQTLDLRSNTLNGKIPEEYFSLFSLERLFLGSNYLTGTLSTSTDQLKSLKDLNLRINMLSGTIPSELGELTLLTNLALGNNRFTGQIPGELGLLQNLSLLDINSNQLTGILPPQLNLLEDTTIDYYGNNLII